MENQWLHDPIIIPARLHSAQVGVPRFWSPCSGDFIHMCWDFICAGISYVLGFNMCRDFICPRDFICAGISFTIVLTSLYDEPKCWHNASMIKKASEVWFISFVLSNIYSENIKLTMRELWESTQAKRLCRNASRQPINHPVWDTFWRCKSCFKHALAEFILLGITFIPSKCDEWWN